MQKCTRCVNEYNNIISLARHWVRTHKLETKILFMELNGLKEEPTCKCGCGGIVKFLDAGRGFSEYVRGHIARIHNNWGNNPKAREKSLETRREMIKDGTWKPFFENETGEHWAKGKTKETDTRVAQQILTRETPEYKKKSSKRMSEMRLNGTIPTLVGSESSQWKGGTSPLLNVCHANSRLYKEWKYPILLTAMFTCQKCKLENKKENNVVLHVHHDKVKMATIVRLIAENNNWESFYGKSTEVDNPILSSLKQKISDEVADYHIKNNVSGIVLCESCHTSLHKKMNF